MVGRCQYKYVSALKYLICNAFFLKKDSEPGVFKHFFLVGG